MVNFEQIYSVSKEIYEAVQQAKENQKQCKELADRVTALEKVARNLEEHNDRDEATEATLERMLVKLRECLNFVLEFSKSRNTVMKLVKSKDYHKELIALDKALTTGVIDLNTALTTQLTAGVSKKRGSIFIKRTDKKEDQEERTLYVLERLEKLFVEERYWNDKTDNFDAYNQCLKEARPELALLYKYGKENKHVLKLNQKELTPAETINELHQTVALAQSKLFLRLVAEGEQDKAEAMLKSSPTLALASGEVTDLSKRTFTNITGFQYAVWALDWHMWTMIRKYLPPEEAQRQAQGFETGAWVRQHGVHANLNTLIQAYQTTIDLYDAGKYAEGDSAWVKQVGGAQLLLPAHVVNEYCHPTRPFYPLPNFKDAAGLMRISSLDIGEWFTAQASGGKLGEKFACYRADRLAWLGRRGMGMAGSLKGGMSEMWGWVAVDASCVRALASARTAQREELIAELRPKNVRRF